MAQYRRGVRWTVLVGVALLAGCQQLEPTVQPTALPGPVPASVPDTGITVAGQPWRTCTRKQMRQYPPVLDAPATTYYAGPWCQEADGGNRYMWLYAKPLSPQQTPEEVRGYVNEDGSLLVRGLRTTGYLAVRTGDRGDDTFYEARRPTSPNLVSIAVLGDEVPPHGQSYSGDSPLRITVAVRKARPEDTPSPTASPSPSLGT